jgi:hypothetical protein
MDMQMWVQMGPLLGIGFVVLLVLIVVPLAIRSARKGRRRAEAYRAGPTARTGLVQRGKRYEGVFQGFPAFIEPNFEYNYAGLAAGLLWGKGLGGSMESMGRQAFFHRYAFGLQVPGGRFPATAFYERGWWAIFGDVEHQRRKPAGEKLDVDLPLARSRLHVHGTDARFAAAVAGSPELLPHLEKWPYLNLALDGETVTLDLIHHWNELESKFGRASMYNWDFAATGLSMMAAAARAALAAQGAAPATAAGGPSAPVAEGPSGFGGSAAGPALEGSGFGGPGAGSS